MTKALVFTVAAAAAVACAQASPNAWKDKYSASSTDLSFSGIVTFAHLEHRRCLVEDDATADIIVLGIPFDTSVSYRPGARFGPNAIRQGSRRHAANRAYSIPWNFNPLLSGPSFLDCGDIPVSPYDNELALDQIEVAYSTLLDRPVKTARTGPHTTAALDGRQHPRIVSLGGDHTIVLPILRSLKKVYGPISVIHFDAHLDTWIGTGYNGATSPQSQITHGTFFWKAFHEGLIANGSSIHAGIRTRLSGFEDLENDANVGFQLLTTDDIDELKPSGIIEKIKQRVGNTPTYLSFDIDTIDPSMAPATGTPESGGWTTREAKAILRGLSDLNLVGFDIVEVSPAYDTNAELTAMAAADLVQEYFAMATKGQTNGGKAWMPAAKGGQIHDEREGLVTSTRHDEL
ncbi:agmatinase [Sporobolomyces koalae]|uniref:agmatinase n=1 Tax=Sporobolomyces koalae TaxID=500713 RepID=UPI0031707F1E